MKEEVKVGEAVYVLAPIRVGQMKEMAKLRQAGMAGQSFLDENIRCVYYCLLNAGEKEIQLDGHKEELTFEAVEQLDYPIYMKLLEKAQALSGFVKGTPGELGAA